MNAKNYKRIFITDGNELKIQVHCAFNELVEVDKMMPHPDNPNVHPSKQITRLAFNIANHGWRQVITVSKRSKFVVSGHARLLAAKELNLLHVPVNYQSFKSKAMELAVLVSDNEIAELATISGPAMADILLHLDNVNYDLSLTGMDKKKIEDYIGGPVNMPEEITLPEPKTCPNCGALLK